jgi:hypothetical protein
MGIIRRPCFDRWPSTESDHPSVSSFFGIDIYFIVALTVNILNKFWVNKNELSWLNMKFFGIERYFSVVVTTTLLNRNSSTTMFQRTNFNWIRSPLSKLFFGWRFLLYMVTCLYLKWVRVYNLVGERYFTLIITSTSLNWNNSTTVFWWSTSNWV